MAEPNPIERTELQIPIFEPIVEESVDVTRVQPALGAAVPGRVSVACACGHRGTVKAEFAGRVVSCPKCRRKSTVPT